MIRAILAGQKTQTRRILETQMYAQQYQPFTGDFDENGHPEACWQDSGCMTNVVCPYGVVGDRLWVRETALPDFPKEFTYYEGTWSEVPEEYRTPKHVLCAASWTGHDLKWKSPIFLPRWASRITLEITDIRVERVQDISEEDAIAEGCQGYTEYRYIPGEAVMEPDYDVSARDAYRAAWDSLNKRRGFEWDANNWVWVLSFKRIEQEAAHV